MSRARRKSLSLQMQERAIVHTWDIRGEDASVSKHYVTAMDFTQQGLLIYSSTPLPMGEIIDIAISLQGQPRPHNLKGVTRSTSRSDSGKGYVISVDLVSDKNMETWRHQFH